ncbi:MAG: hydantoinase B/oxoprolinase family protein [Steroidobacteraceae bacterium]|jgi:N-methylhydantoinase B|nr:hydantoinase B/oxoprolinase family protein [Steroidobacteraceae bacterium]
MTTNARRSQLSVYRPHDRRSATGSAAEADPVTTQVVRHSLSSAANQMKRVLVRAAYSPIIYEAQDFAVALYDRQARMLAQAPTLPAFMGTMSFCVEAAVAGVGGEAKLEPGDVILYNMPYGTGSHAQDAALVMPVYMPDGELVGYATNKAHWLDVGAKNSYCTDTTDVFQEGVVFPGVKLYRRGELAEDILAIVLANSRMPRPVRGDLLAQVASCRVGAEELVRVVQRYGSRTFWNCVERMYEHGEAVVRAYVEQIPDGRYEATGHLDNDGIGDEPVHFKVAIEVAGSTVRVDFSDVPDARPGPLNCPLPSTVSCCRIALAMLAGNSEAPNEGHFRPLEVVTRPGSMFHPVAPQPCYMYGWPLMSAMEAMYEALSRVLPGQVPSGSAGDLCGVQYWGFDRERNEPFYGGCSFAVGQGASARGDGATLFVAPLGQSKVPAPELMETKWPLVRFERWEFAPDSGGPGRHRGGLGWDVHWKFLENVELVSVMERTREPSWGQAGGLSGAPNRFVLSHPDGGDVEIRKVTGLRVSAGSVVKIRCGGGGGYGSPAERDPDAVRTDLRLGYVTEAAARRHHPQAFD